MHSPGRMKFASPLCFFLLSAFNILPEITPTLTFQKTEASLDSECCSRTILVCAALGSFDPATGLAHLPYGSEVFCADRHLWMSAGESLSRRQLLQTQTACSLTPESLVGVQSRLERDIAVNNCSLSNLSDLPRLVTKVYVTCRNTTVYPNVSLVTPASAEEELNCTMSSSVCDCLTMTAAKWLLLSDGIRQDLKCADSSAFFNGLTNLVWTAGPSQCLGSEDSPCYRGVWKVVLEWSFVGDIDLYVDTPEKCEASSSVECTDCFQSVCLDTFGGLAVVSSNDAGEDGTGREELTITNADGSDSDAFYDVEVLSFTENVNFPSNGNITASLFFDGAPLAVIVMNVDEDSNEWETFNIFTAKGTFDIRDKLEYADRD